MIFRRKNLFFTLTILIFSSISVIGDSSYCNSVCGSGKSAKRVNFPFGFSDSCKIQLNCSRAGDIQIGEFKVQNITTNSIFVNLPAKCNRKMDSIKPLFQPNFGFSWDNNLLFQKCTKPSSGCSIQTSFINDWLNLSCNSTSDNITCNYERGHGIGVMGFANLSGCKYLFTSLTSEETPAAPIQFAVVKLEWWLNRNCSCSGNAKCTNVSLADGENGFRCNCLEGYEGDGFANGLGCRKVASCNDSKNVFGHCGGTTKVGLLVGGAIAGASLMATLALICYFIQRHSTSSRNKMSAKHLLTQAAGYSSIPFFPYKEIERSTNGFSEKQRLGTGAYGTVYAGKLYGGEWVAIKKIKHRDTESIDQVMNEIKLLSSVNHPNLVRLLGWCIERGEQILVYEFMPNGTLSQHLQRERGKGLPWTIRLTIAAETAHAIAHLHSAMNPPIYHRDIKSSNILLDYNFNSKVADFGLSRLGMVETSHISTAPQGTPGYLDPQYHQNFHLSDKSDVYSFGVVLVEIITALKVVDFSRPHSEVNLAALAIDRIGRGCIDEIIDPFLDPHRDAWTLTSVHRMAELAFRCLAFHRDMRPSMMEVADELEQIRLSGWAPMDENICMSSSVASSCSSPYNGSERSLGSMKIKKLGNGSHRLIVPMKIIDNVRLEEVKDTSPVSVHDPWLSEQSSPSANSLLGNVIQ